MINREFLQTHITKFQADQQAAMMNVANSPLAMLIDYHRIGGAIAILTEMLALLPETPPEQSSTETLVG